MLCGKAPRFFPLGSLCWGYVDKQPLPDSLKLCLLGDETLLPQGVTKPQSGLILTGFNKSGIISSCALRAHFIQSLWESQRLVLVPYQMCMSAKVTMVLSYLHI